ncbi:MAG: hypothetical protein MZW92_01040 [Comamonadaceae bacterium]|nr:hypothetical protein [Comamonadaceae bacterium]
MPASSLTVIDPEADGRCRHRSVRGLGTEAATLHRGRHRRRPTASSPAATTT